MQKDTNVALIFCVVIAGLLVLTFALRNDDPATVATGENGAVSVQNGVQVITVTAKGGYTPGRIEATAGIPTELRVTTQGTFDCSASLVIPKLSYEAVLAPTGVETIVIAPDQAQGTIEGTCGMGMYAFEMTFI